MNFEYNPKGVCSMKISFDLEDGIVKNIKFLGGCNGNTQGVSKLAEGRRAEEIISALDGIKCGFRQTSCPDQFATALKDALVKGC